MHPQQVREPTAYTKREQCGYDTGIYGSLCLKQPVVCSYICVVLTD